MPLHCGKWPSVLCTKWCKMYQHFPFEHIHTHTSTPNFRVHKICWHILTKLSYSIPKFVYSWYLMTICSYQTYIAPYPKSTQFFRKITFHSLSGVSQCPLPSGPVRWALYLLPNPKNLAKSGCWNVEWNIMWCQDMPHRSWLHQSSKQSVAFKRLARNLSICGFPILFQLPPIAGRQLEKVPSFLSWTSGPPTWKIGRSVFLLCFSLAWAFTLNLRTGLAANDCLVHDANPASSSHKTWKGHCKGLFYILQLQHISFQEGRGTWRKSPQTRRNLRSTSLL